MKQVLSLRGGAKTVREVPAPGCRPGEVLVRNAFSVISSGTERSSGEDSHGSLVGRAMARPDLVREVVGQAAKDGIAETRRAVRRRLDQTSVVGYSSAGQVIEVGTAVTGLDAGDLVACAGVGYANHAEIVSVPRNLCAKVPPGVALEPAALTTIAAVALHGVRLADVRLGDRTAVIGCGLIGQIACRLLRAAGSEVYALDIDAERAAAAEADHHAVAGADAVTGIMSATAALGVDHVLITAASSSSEPLRLAAEIARDRADVVVVGEVPIEIARSLMFSKELSLRVSRSYGPGRYDPDYERHGIDYPAGYVRWTQQRNMESILELQARGRLVLVDLIEEVVPIDDAPSAYERLAGPAEARPRGAIAIAYPEPEDAPVLTPPAAVRAPTPVVPGGAHEPVQIGLIGPGEFARSVILPALSATGAQLVMVGGGSGPAASATAHGFSFARLADSEDALLADAEVDAVVICTRHGSHAELSARALEAGKHVFCEKPLALSPEELDRVLGAAHRSGKVLAVGFNRRFAPLTIRLRRFLAGPGPVTVTYRVSAGAIRAEHWVHDLEQGGGRVLGEVCHFIDTISFLVGSPVVEVHAKGFSNIDRSVQARDNVAVTLSHANGSLGTIAYVASSAPGVGKERIETFGQSGIGVLDDFRLLELHGASADRVKCKGQQKGHREELAAFVQGVRDGRLPVPLSELANVSLATLAVVEGMRTGASVRIDLNAD